ncbi:DUF1902 domain-containing protein [Methylocystis sp. MJC1]|jgi:hypothetical protein|uniref:DUF1902 domain-containing protein n=1 Tax=Methylocystis sp. MJC1 TaxID=2654282 RepID=UPI0013EA30CD|nr:DUF1902 domain-containing protein [Methylocystis sp. MJC1]MBU6528118.1 DUF1902 domain-containing protein [Methylocystis sp. MJC1]UZX13769.1 DUF1902 domain-containing protein [Methylocystis sp. MJC1]
MPNPVQIDAEWDDEARVWIATSDDAPGLVVEAETWQAMIDDVRVILPGLLGLNEGFSGDLALTFRAETRLALACG